MICYWQDISSIALHYKARFETLASEIASENDKLHKTDGVEQIESLVVLG